MPAPVMFFGSQIGGETVRPLSYTGVPWELFVHDILLFLRWCYYLPNIVIPLGPWPSGSLDELFPSPANLYTMFLHLIAFVVQAVWIVSLPFFFYLPFPLYVAYFVGFLIFNELFCRLLNGYIPPEGLRSTEDEFSESWKKHDDEYWIFLNGVAVGQHWLQANIDRISRTFHRPVIGVHNKTSGIIFDTIQCLIQRSLLYATQDVRDCYVLIKKAIYRPDVKKVIVILHSQGAIEGSMILDWLLNEVPQNLLSQLEVYTFGNAANHFNNPYHDEGSSIAASSGFTHSPQKFNRVIAHLEHYGNSKDFVSRWGVLNYTQAIPKDRFENRFMGRVFERRGKGHQFNQHYLDNMFPLDPTCRFVRDVQKGDFMDIDVDVVKESSERESAGQSLLATKGDAAKHEVDEVFLLNISPTSAMTDKGEGPFWRRAENWVHRDMARNGEMKTLKVKDISRLWTYRNGGVPAGNV
ncbi:hypothetical protein F5882DRAFT_455079 [Hyaloscypha sp. PMI_1271]|nr:hypothetical protein F5882DRAFT_455079 [Hyaloscypha sp. PMI_1271]